MRRLFLLVFVLLLLNLRRAGAQEGTATPKTGANDTVLVSAILYDNEWIPYSTLPTVLISNVSGEKLAKAVEAYNRLRNAVYVTYRYATEAGAVINDVNAHLQGVTSKKERKKYIKSREQELKKKFSEPLSNLSVYQGKVLMKLINRETGNDCYEIIKEYRGGLNARMYQTVAFFFSSDLRQSYDLHHSSVDRQIETFVQEIRGRWYGGR